MSLVDKPAKLNFQTVRKSLMRIVPLCLDSDPSLLPISCKGPLTARPDDPDGSYWKGGEDIVHSPEELDVDEGDQRDADDFTFWSENQAKRICGAIEQAFGVEYAPDVVIADANLTTLANRILLSKEILTSGTE